MGKNLAFLFPGQGAQIPGMGKDFYEQFTVARRVFEEADAFLQCPFSKLIFEGPSEELTLTKNSQIAIYITSIAILRTIQERFPHLVPVVCAGLSLGEYTALTAARRLPFTAGLDLVRIRAEAMHKACEEVRGSMQVVLGLTEEKVLSVVNTLNPPHPLWLANINCPGQIVIAGSLEALAIAQEPLKQQGAKRILPLDVSGAFHSGLMRSAQEALRLKIELTPFQESSIQVVMNVPGDFVHSSAALKQNLIDQVVSPVRWEKGILAMEKEGITAYIEMGPGKTLSGMNKRIGLTHPTYSIEKITDIEALCNC